jgi:hypothetical protein
MPRPTIASADAGDTIRLLVKKPDRTRAYVIMAIILCFAGFAVATVLST